MPRSADIVAAKSSCCILLMHTSSPCWMLIHQQKGNEFVALVFMSLQIQIEARNLTDLNTFKLTDILCTATKY
jgi:dihydropteroate synthase